MQYAGRGLGNMLATDQLHDHMSFGRINEILKNWVICIVNQNRPLPGKKAGGL